MSPVLAQHSPSQRHPLRHNLSLGPQLWTYYGDLTEIWFDGGFSVPGLEQRLLALLNSTQPHAVVFNGCGLR